MSSTGCKKAAADSSSACLWLLGTVVPHHDVMSEDAGARTAGGGYALRSVAVAEDLDELDGPLDGIHQLPLHLDSSAREDFDFGDPHRRELAYRIVLLEAGSVTDLQRWLSRDQLVAMWPDLYLPRVVRAAWQRRHPVLAEAGASPGIPAA